MNKVKRMLQKLRITGVAGVDHPAHLHPGWAVIKSHQPVSVEEVEAEALEPVRQELRADASTLDEITRVSQQNARELEQIEQATRKLTERQAETQSMLEDQLGRFTALRAWVGSDLRKVEEPRLTPIDIGRSVWGLES